MRVIAGALKGRRLETPSWDGLRPTSDKLRETLFNVLAARVDGATILDGFAGTGALGIEALSRGAASVTFVDRDRRAAALTASNLVRCGVRERYRILTGSLTQVLKRLPRDPGFQPFDVALLDPPYMDRTSGRHGTAERSPDRKVRLSGRVERTRSRNVDGGDPARSLETLLAAVAAVTAAQGVVVLEHARKTEPPTRAGRLARTRELVSGDSALSFYAMMHDAPAVSRAEAPPTSGGAPGGSGAAGNDSIDDG